MRQGANSLLFRLLIVGKLAARMKQSQTALALMY